MKKIIKLGLLTLFLVIISSIVVVSFGKTFDVKFATYNGNKHNINLSNETGKVEIIEEKKVDDKYIVKVKAIKPGKAIIYYEHDGFQEGVMLYIHKNMVITAGNYFGESTYSEIIPVSITIVLSYILYLLIQRYNQNKNENLYQYKNIAYLGIIIFLSFFTLSNFLSIFDYHGLFGTIGKTISSISALSVIMFPLALITFILVTISNIKLIAKEGKSLKNLLGLFLGIFICLSTLLPDFVYRLLMKTQKVDIYNLNSAGPYIYNFVESLVYLTISYLECILLGTIIVAIKSVKKKPKYNKDYIIILGCQIRKDGTLTPLLKGRVDKAIEFRNNQLKESKKDLIFIPSGGKGKDEVISEAEAMKNYLLGQGIKEKNILVENKSKDTYENIKFSNKLINNKKTNIAFSTTNYHVLRAGLIATEQGLKLEGIGSKTKAYFWINAFIREFIGTLYAEKKKHIMVFILISIILCLMIWITYLANNL